MTEDEIIDSIFKKIQINMEEGCIVLPEEEGWEWIQEDDQTIALVRKEA